MSNRPFSPPAPVITNGSMTADITSLPTFLAQKTRGSYEISWSGTSPIGTISLEGSDSYSLDPVGGTLNSGIWTTMTVSVGGTPMDTIPVSGNTGSILIDFNTGLNAVRVFYDFTSGTGTMNALITAKVS